MSTSKNLNLSPWWESKLQAAQAQDLIEQVIKAKTHPQPTPKPITPRATLKEQATLLQGLASLNPPPQRPDPRQKGLERAKQLETEAYTLLSSTSTILSAYQKLTEARTLAIQYLGDPPSRDLFTTALLMRLGHALRGYTEEAAQALLLLALEVALARNYHPTTSEVAYLIPVNLLAHRLWPNDNPETARKRFVRALPKLEKLGLLRYQAHQGNATDHQTGERNHYRDGTLIQIRIRPGQATSLTPEHFKVYSRDLNTAIKAKKTATKLMSQSFSPKGESKDLFTDILEIAIAPALQNFFPAISNEWDTSGPKGNLVTLASTVASPQAAVRNLVQEVKLLPKKDRRDGVGEACYRLTRIMQDRNSQRPERLYGALLWGMLREWDQGKDFSDALITVLSSVMVDMKEGNIRKPGALMVLRLKERGLWNLVERPPLRVAS